MKNIIYSLIVLLGVLSSCTDDLNVTPIDPNTATPDKVYTSLEGYDQVLGKIYASYNVSGQKGNDNESDVSTIPNGGMSAYFRNYWNFQTVTTGEALNSWGDDGLVPLQNGEWSADNSLVAGMFYRLYFMISLTNEFLVEATDAKLDERGLGDIKDQVKAMRAEARLVRAISYFHGLDFFGQMSIIEPGSTDKFPVAANKKAVFEYTVSQLDTIMADLPDAGMAEYGRMDKGTAYIVLAKLHLNALNLTGVQNPISGVTSMDEVIKYTDLINKAYTFEANYLKLFSTDNKDASGIVFAIPHDNAQTQGFSASQYIISSSTNGDYLKFVGLTDPGAAWGGNRATSSILEKFTLRPNGDMRGKLQKLEDIDVESGEELDYNTMFVEHKGMDITNPLDYTQGINVFKFKNRSSNGDYQGSDKDPYFVDTDWPMYRLADSYLMYAEAVLRGGNGGSSADALVYVNKVVERGYGNADSNLTLSQLTLDFLLEERAREFYYEGYRRLDLIRFEKFTSASYLWPWKGGVENGRGLSNFRNIFPIPTSELTANPNAIQNSGY